MRGLSCPVTRMGALVNPVGLWFELTLLMMVVAVGFRIWRPVLAPVRLEKVGVQEVARMVRDFLESTTDGAFGFPTGFFYIDDDASTPTVIVAREAVTWSSRFLAVLRRFFLAIASVAPEFGCVGVLGGMLLAALLAPLVLYAAGAELALRFLLRSEIVAKVTPLPGADAGSEVVFTLRGPSALLVGRAVQRAFHPPQLPDRIRGLARLPA
jgi:hypothetical protein